PPPRATGQVRAREWRRGQLPGPRVPRARRSGSLPLQYESLTLSGEAFVGRTEESRQRLEVVAAFQHGRDLWAQRGRPFRKLAKAGLGDEHSGERIVLVRVESGRHEDELGLESLHGRLHELVERLQVVLVRRAGRGGDVAESPG